MYPISCLQSRVLIIRYCNAIVLVGKWGSFRLTEVWLENCLGSDYLYLDILSMSYFFKFKIINYIMTSIAFFEYGTDFLWLSMTLLFHLMKNFKKWDIHLVFKNIWKIIYTNIYSFELKNKTKQQFQLLIKHDLKCLFQAFKFRLKYSIIYVVLKPLLGSSLCEKRESWGQGGSSPAAALVAALACICRTPVWDRLPRMLTASCVLDMAVF